MAESPSHKLGQIIGTMLEATVLPELRTFCERYGLYLDSGGPRPGVRTGTKASWRDKFDNSHDLDFIVEVDGAHDRQGRPLAFIECAWRRYTKHSRNKAQEIQGAVLPIAEKHHWDRPFLGAVLAGEFTESSLTQLRSNGFAIVYLSYSLLQEAFAQEGVDITFNEKTSDDWFSRTIAGLTGDAAISNRIVERIRIAARPQFNTFFEQLEKRLERFVEKLTVVPLFGAEAIFDSVDAALAFLASGKLEAAEKPDLKKVEVVVRYSNGDRLEAQFADVAQAADFLRYVAR